MLSIVGLTLALAIVVFSVRTWGKYGLSMILGATIVALFSYQHLPVWEIPAVFWKALVSEDTIALTIGVVLIGMLTNAMKETGEIERLIDSLEAKVPAEGRMIILPTIFGLLPIQGGALMSAPYIDEDGEKNVIAQHTKMFLNLWYRHVIFIIYPLSTTLIFISEQALGGKIHQIILIQIPAFLLSLLAGSVPLLKSRRNTSDLARKEKNGGHTYTQIFINFLPISITIIVFTSLTYLSNLSSFVSLAVSVPFGIATSFLLAGTPKTEIEKILKNGFSADNALAVVGVMIFYKTIQSSGLCNVLSGFIQQLTLPISFLITVTSFLMGIATGDNFAAVALSYAILEPLAGGKLSLPMLSLLYVSAWVGHLLSPVHLCVALSYEYFKPKFANFYRLYIPPALLILGIWAVAMTVL